MLTAGVLPRNRLNLRFMSASHLVILALVGVSRTDLFLSAFWQIGELDTGAPLRLSDTLTPLQPVCIPSTPSPPPPRSRSLKLTLCKQLRLRTLEPKLRRVWKKQGPFWFCLGNNRRGRARHANRPWHYGHSRPASWVKWKGLLVAMCFRRLLLCCWGVWTWI